MRCREGLVGGYPGGVFPMTVRSGCWRRAWQSASATTYSLISLGVQDGVREQ